MTSHALCQGCKYEYMVLALEVPTIKLKRQHITLSFLYNEATSQLVLIAQFASRVVPKP